MLRPLWIPGTRLHSRSDWCLRSHECNVAFRIDEYAAANAAKCIGESALLAMSIQPAPCVHSVRIRNTGPLKGINIGERDQERDTRFFASSR